MNIKPIINSYNKGILNHCNKPHPFLTTISLARTIKTAKPKLITIVVNVKKMLSAACFVLLYWNLNKGTADSMIQKKLMPPASINARCKLGIVSKYDLIASIIGLFYTINVNKKPDVPFVMKASGFACFIGTDYTFINYST
jgi:hypothetical protein